MTTGSSVAFVRRTCQRFGFCLIAWTFSLAASFASVCVADDARPARTLVVFSAMGDIPYAAEEFHLLEKQLQELPRESAFVVHLGDIKTGQAPCDPAAYETVAGLLKKSPIPLFNIPGDNEWNDCPQPDQAWELWTKSFLRFDQNWKHGFTVQRQADHEENFAFVKSEVLFIGLNLVGGRVHDAKEWSQRHARNLEWTRQNLELYRDSIRNAVIFGHAFPVKAHDDYFRGLSKLADDFQKPVLYLHGDGHRWIRNRPFASKRILRIQVDQGGIAPPIAVTVTDDPTEPFVVDRRQPDK